MVRAPTLVSPRLLNSVRFVLAVTVLLGIVVKLRWFKALYTSHRSWMDWLSFTRRMFFTAARLYTSVPPVRWVLRPRLPMIPELLGLKINGVPGTWTCPGKERAGRAIVGALESLDRTQSAAGEDADGIASVVNRVGRAGIELPR